MKDIALRIITRLMIPYILIFGLYILLHGEISPGGGFQAGAIIASALMLHVVTFGIEKTKELIPLYYIKIFMSLGLIIYCLVGFFGILYGGNFLDYNVLANTPLKGQKLGILIVEIGITFTVFASITLIFYLFVQRK